MTAGNTAWKSTNALLVGAWTAAASRGRICPTCDSPHAPQGKVTGESYVWYKSMGKEWKRLTDNAELLQALAAKTQEERNAAEGLNALREVSAIRIQRCARSWLAHIVNRDLDYDSGAERAELEAAPEMPELAYSMSPLVARQSVPRLSLYPEEDLEEINREEQPLPPPTGVMHAAARGLFYLAVLVHFGGVVRWGVQCIAGTDHDRGV